ncbi:hypothetical protein ABH313_21830 [Chromobacterium vaccinii]|uniref:hypothetical protein n=1 Tax=Chromobacterium vaccinii TaxID=1108595 RepID=UPI0032611869
MNRQIQNHPNFDADDYAYLRAKGWSDEDILHRWQDEAASGQPACRWAAPVARQKLQSVLRSAAQRN